MDDGWSKSIKENDRFRAFFVCRPRSNKPTFGGRDLYQWEFDWNMQDGVPDRDYRECFWDEDYEITINMIESAYPF